jgi:hypothetical protein
MSEVFLLWKLSPYEPNELLGAFSTIEKAIEAAKEFGLQPDVVRIERRAVDDGIAPSEADFCESAFVEEQCGVGFWKGEAPGDVLLASEEIFLRAVLRFQDEGVARDRDYRDAKPERDWEHADEAGRLEIGVDPARFGSDDSAICVRRGMKVLT